MNDEQLRVKSLYADHLRHIQYQAHALFVGLLLLEWVGAVAAAIWISPLTWIGEVSRVHLHVWAAIGLGGAIVSLPLLMIVRWPAHWLTTHAVAVAQALFSVLLIHLTGGRIETHFHVFGSLAFLAIYRDWRLLVTASAIVAVDHGWRGVFWPASVYGVFEVEPWRWLEHVGWVLFEDVFLTLSILQSCRQNHCLAERQTQLEATNARIEQTVVARTAELRAAEEQLRHSQKLEAIGTLAGGMAHEFNNLLQAIRGYTEFATDSLPDGHSAHDDLQQVLKASERAATLTRQMLGFGRRQVLRPEWCEPNQLVRDGCKLLRPLIGEQIELRIVYAPETGRVRLDPNEFQQLLMNLCVNARDAMPSGGELLVKTAYVTRDEEYSRIHPDTPPGTYVELTVADTGCGMTREVRERIFEPFFTTKEVGKGTGLGLAMVYGTVQQQRGTIHVYSEPGQGTVMKVYLPTDAEPAAPPIETPLLPSPRGQETILVAEDEPLVRDMTVRVLEMAGYRTLTARDGEEAVDVYREHVDDVGLVLLDMVMPKLNGRDARRRMLELRPHTRVLFCSGYDPETAQSQRLADEGLPMIQKPYDPHVMLRQVRELLDS